MGSRLLPFSSLELPSLGGRLERRSPVCAAPLTWQQFSVLFLEKYVSQSHRDELYRQFEQLRHDDMVVVQYEIRFSELDHHAICLVPTDRERIRRFVDGLTYQLQILMTRERVSGASFEEVVDIARDIESIRRRDSQQGHSSLNAFPSQSSSRAPSVQGSSMPDCSAKTVTLVMPGLPRIEWRGSLDYVPSRVISHLKAQRMVGKRCLSYSAFVRDVSGETPTIDSVPVVRDFLDIFPVGLSGMPPDRDIDFGIDLVRGTQPISIPPCCMVIAELKEQLQELLEKGFIRPSFVQGLSFITSPLTKLTQKGALFKWWDEYEVSFQKLKTVLTTAPVERQYDDPHLLVLKDKVRHDDARNVTIRDDGVLRMQGRICVPNMKYEHQRSSDELQHIEIPEWKWEQITMVFVVGLTRTSRKSDAIWVIVDRLTKSVHFIPMSTTYSSDQLAEIYIREIVRLHGVTFSIISY
ncbi:uncharacterized protein [Nicotiana sylvestris]|uniref:uncharacterized protein n=1 Tax=Nicotiana sylvestris TaxID=4096 RepID=UPI00388CEAD2